ncbi:MAG: response regulator [Deltaproteobacteria bacterium]|nr:MAG: response regulator [Deltaproteobacteria bacterium]
MKVAGPQRVLVVDDEQYYRDTIRDALGLEGIACDVAASPAELLKAIEDPRIACVVLDVKLTPDPVGLIEALLEQRTALRVIALATQSDQDLVLAALHGGACDYLAKPIHDEELCLAVYRALRGYAIESRFAALSEQLWRLAEHGEPTAPGDREALAEPDEALLRALADRVAAPAPASEDGAASGEAELLRAVAEGMTREIEPARLLAASLRPIARATSARVVSLYLIDNATGRLVCEAQCEGSEVDRAELPRDAGLTGGSLQSGALVAADRPERDARFDPGVDTPESGTPGPLLVVPLRVRDRVLGVARVFPDPSIGASARLAELLAAPLSAATRNVLLYRSLLESVEDVARARRESEGRR